MLRLGCHQLYPVCHVQSLPVPLLTCSIGQNQHCRFQLALQLLKRWKKQVLRGVKKVETCLSASAIPVPAKYANDAGTLAASGWNLKTSRWVIIQSLTERLICGRIWIPSLDICREIASAYLLNRDVIYSARIVRPLLSRTLSSRRSYYMSCGDAGTKSLTM